MAPGELLTALSTGLVIILALVMLWDNWSNDQSLTKIKNETNRRAAPNEKITY